MPEKAKSELSVVRAEYKAATGKNPSPKDDIAALKAKIAAAGADAPAPAPEAGPDAPEAAAAEPKAKAAKPANEPAPEADAPLGTAYIRHSDPDASASYQGVKIAPNEKGLCLVPLAAVPELVSHGFELVGAGPAE